MDIKEYISSGIIEQYVLGTLSSQEVQEVECMSHIYPEILEELRSIQNSIEKMALKSAVRPSDEVKLRVLQEIKNVPQLEKEDEEKGNVIPFNKESKPSTSISMNKWKMGLAASIVGILALAGFAIMQNQNIDTLASNIEKQNSTISKLEETAKQNGIEADFSKSQLAFITNKRTKRVDMAGTPNHEQNFASVYWNQEQNKYLLDSKGMPQAPTGKQYQLWAIVDGVPVDMGVFKEDDAGLIDQTFNGTVQAFAVTLEPEGGSVSPTLEEMRVVGNV